MNETRKPRFVPTVLVFILVAALSGCRLPVLLYAKGAQKYRSGIRGPEEIFIIRPLPGVLTEEWAAFAATKTLEREGYKLDQWTLTSMHRNQTAATVRFTGQGRYRLYFVRLNAENISCHSAHGTQRDPESWSTRPKPDHPAQRYGKVRNQMRPS